MSNRSLLSLILVAAGLPGCGAREPGTACLDIEDDVTTCPDASEVDVDELFVPFDCDGNKALSISGTGTPTDVGDGSYADSGIQDLACCYEAEVLDPKPNQDCVIGRPFHDGGRAWSAPTSVPRDARAAAWARAGAAEHASVAAFARLALELIAHGAPLDLLRDVARAGADEVDHAEACFGLAARVGGGPVTPGPFPFPGPVAVSRPLAEIAADAVHEGCVGETVGAVLARAAAERVADPEVRAAFEAIAADEERHAVLSWRIVAWAVRAGGPEVRAAVAEAFRAPAPGFDLDELALRAGLDRADLDGVVEGAVRAVVRPAAVGLLALRRPDSPRRPDLDLRA